MILIGAPAFQRYSAANSGNRRPWRQQPELGHALALGAG